MVDAPNVAAGNGEERRIALVIGNAEYVRARPLINTMADASGVADAFSRVGFRSHLPSAEGGSQPVSPYYNRTLIEMKRLIADFSVASRKANMSVVYFSGHGIEIDFRNFLIPVDAELTHVDRVNRETVSLAEIIEATRGANTLRLVILDACRDNPFVDRMDGLDLGKSTARRGLGAPRDSISALTFYAATEGQVAQQGPKGGRSPFADALITRLLEQRELLRIFGKVTQDVRSKTDGQQEPHLYGPPPGDDIFLIASGALVLPPNPPGKTNEPPPPEKTHGLPIRAPQTRYKTTLWVFVVPVLASALMLAAYKYGVRDSVLTVYPKKSGAPDREAVIRDKSSDSELAAYRGSNAFFKDAIAGAGLEANEATYKALRLPSEFDGRRLKLLSFSSFEGTLIDQDWQGIVQLDELAPPSMFVPRLVGPTSSNIAAVSGNNSLNFAPSIIPVVTGFSPLTGMRHKRKFDVREFTRVWVRFNYRSNTNPRPAAVHNCESALRVQNRVDGGTWQIQTPLCGTYLTETSRNWREFMWPIALVPGSTTFEFALDFTMQNNPAEVKDRFFLIDNAMLIGESEPGTQ